MDSYAREPGMPEGWVPAGGLAELRDGQEVRIKNPPAEIPGKISVDAHWDGKWLRHEDKDAAAEWGIAVFRIVRPPAETQAGLFEGHEKRRRFKPCHVLELVEKDGVAPDSRSAWLPDERDPLWGRTLGWALLLAMAALAVWGVVIR